MKYCKVLVGSNGGLTGIYLAKCFKKNRDIFLVGADCNKDSVGKFFVDRQYFLPPANEKDFLCKLIELLNYEKIDLYLPTHSEEIKAVSQNADFIRSSTSAKFIVSPIESFSALDSKTDANINLSKVGITVPELITDFNVSYPIFMKKVIGSGSNGAFKIENRKIHEAYKENENCAFFENINGTEITVDCFFDTDGNLIGYCQRKRLKTIGGAVVITETFNGFDILPFIKIIADNWKLCGCVNFQYILKDNKPYFIDVNLRYPSGGLPVSVESGLDVPNFILDLFYQRKIPYSEHNFSVNDKKMYRYFEEIFE